MTFLNTRLVLAICALPGLAMAQEPIALDDPNIGMSAQMSSDLDWQVEVTKEGGQSTVVAVHQSESEMIVLQILTMLQVNPAAQSDAARVEFTTGEFLGGLCNPFACADQSNKEYIEVGDRNAWVLETDLDLQDYKNLGIPEAIFAATTTPQGYMQLFSVHTAPGQSGALKDQLLKAVASASFQ